MALIEREGTFECVIVSSGFSVSQGEAKSEQILVGFQDLETLDTIVGFFATSEKAWPYTMKKLATCGWDAKARNFYFEELNDENSPIVGNQVQITVKRDDYNGKAQWKVGFVNPPHSVGTMERMAAPEAASFATRLRQRLGVSSAAPPPLPPRRATPPTPPTSDANDDIGF